MLNILGDVWIDSAGLSVSPAWDQVWALPGVHVHLYDKAQPRQARKMGHVTITASTLEQARIQAQAVEKILRLPPT
jgi:5-(carboxyamino)imidazole ribonucleotide synthase